MRKVVIVTETTGLNQALGDRIIELAAIEIDDSGNTLNRLHRYFNPETGIDPEASEIHGLTSAHVEEAIRFPAFAIGFAEFIRDAELIIHNAPFDLEFLNAEFKNAGLSPVESYCQKVIDTLFMARRQRPWEKNTLVSLCERFEIEYSTRNEIGTMLDAEVLAEVYLQLVKHEIH